MKQINPMKLVFLLIMPVMLSMPAHAKQGVYSDRIIIGGVMDLEGQSRGLGRGMEAGIQAAFKNKKIKGKRLVYVTLNDSYTPELTIKATQKMVDDQVFAMLGNVGTPTAKVSLPILADSRIPAVGFFTGAGLLRPGNGHVINYRASYVQEASAVISQSIKAGLQPKEICAYVQNDAYGMAGVAGIKQALKSVPRTRDIIVKLDEILTMKGDNPQRNGVGPVGVYQRNTLTSRDGYESLKVWEKSQNTQCKLVVTVGTYNAVGRFAGYSKYKGDDWIISAVSFTGANNLRNILSEFGVQDRVVMTQVVPDLNADLPILKEARRALGRDYSYVSLEGYIAGKMFLSILESIDGNITREKFVRASKGSQFELGGLKLDFKNDNQGSDLVSMTYYQNKSFSAMEPAAWNTLF